MHHITSVSVTLSFNMYFSSVFPAKCDVCDVEGVVIVVLVEGNLLEWPSRRVMLSFCKNWLIEINFPLIRAMPWCIFPFKWLVKAVPVNKKVVLHQVHLASNLSLLFLPMDNHFSIFIGSYGQA